MPGPLRLVPCLAVLALSLTACKRDGARAERAREPSETTPTANSPTPTPEDVCRRLSEMAMADIGPIDPAIQAETIAQCADELRLDQLARGPESWDGVARCVVAAQTDADLDRCDALYPPPDAGPRPDSGDGEREKAVCINMVTVFAVELALEAEAVGEPIPQLTEPQIEEAFNECMGVLIDTQQAAPPDVYDALLGCLGGAETGAQLEACVGE